MSSTDPRGFTRERCLSLSCFGCMVYTRGENGNACDYCGCYPAQHEYAELNAGTDQPVALPATSKPAPQTIQTSSQPLVLSPSRQSVNIDEPLPRKSPEKTYTTLENVGQRWLKSADNISGVRTLIETRDESIISNISTSPANTVVVSPTKTPARSPLSPDEYPLQRSNALCVMTFTTTKRQLSFTEDSSAGDRKRLRASCLPLRWPEEIQNVLSASGSTLVRPIKLEMIRIITERTLQNGFTKDDFPWVADYVLEQLPILKSNVVSGNGTLVSAMKDCLRHKKTYSNKKARKADSDCVQKADLKDIKSQMKSEAQKARPSLNKMKGLLALCRAQRNRDSKTSSATEHLQEYPALKKPELVLWEFCEMLMISQENLKLRWSNALPKLVTYFQVDTNGRDMSEDQLTALVVQAVCKKMGQPPQKKTQKQKVGAQKENVGAGIFRVYELNSPVEDTKPKPSEPPCIVAIGDVTGSHLHVVVYVDQVALFAGKPSEAVVMLVAAYYVFQVNWPNVDKLAMILLSAILIPDKLSAEIAKFKTVLAALESMNVTIEPVP